MSGSRKNVVRTGLAMPAGCETSHAAVTPKSLPVTLVTGAHKARPPCLRRSRTESLSCGHPKSTSGLLQPARQCRLGRHATPAVYAHHIPALECARRLHGEHSDYWCELSCRLPVSLRSHAARPAVTQARACRHLHALACAAVRPCHPEKDVAKSSQEPTQCAITAAPPSSRTIS